jgi:uncharacterized protein (TIGR02996 family)
VKDEEEFLKAIRANPADDTVRLVYADYLEEHPKVCPMCRGQGSFFGPPRKNESGGFTYGEKCGHCKGAKTVDDSTRSDRAEYIRLQCELRKYAPQANWLELMPVDQWTGGGEEGKLLRRLEPLVRRHADLSKKYVRDCGQWSREFIESVFGLSWLQSSATWQWMWVRGFVSEVYLPSEDFFRQALTLFQLQPITRVVLTDKSPWEGQNIIPEDDRSFCWWLETPHRITQDGPNDPGNIPAPLFEIMWKANKGNQCKDNFSDDLDGRWLRWDDSAIPGEELSAACVDYARRLAGLPELRPCPLSMM